MGDPNRPRDPSYRPLCPACQADRLHTLNERYEHHPYAGHGFAQGQGWSHPDLVKEAHECTATK